MKRVVPFLIIAILTLSSASRAQSKSRPAKPQAKPASASSATPGGSQVQKPGGARAGASQAGGPNEQKPADQKPAEQKKDEDCGCDSTAPPDTLALVNGTKVAPKEVDDPIKDQLQELRNQIADSRKRQLEGLINLRLFDAEARRRGINRAKLLQIEVTPKVKQPTEAEARAFYEQNKTQIQGTFDETRQSIIGYLRNQKEIQEEASYGQRLRTGAQVKVLANEATPPAKEADRARVFATVNGENITSGELEDSLRPLLFNINDQIYEARKKQLDLRINDLLLDQEVEKRKTNLLALLQAELPPRTKKVTDADAQKFYNENKARLEGDFAQLRDKIIQYLLQAEQRAASEAFVAELRKTAKLQVFLTPPEPPVFKIATEGRPSKGAASSPVTIVEFTDLQCPSCARTQPLLEELVDEYPGKVRLVTRNFPLQQHENAVKAAQAAEAARAQGKYYEYIAVLFQNQNALTVDKLKEYASRLGLDRKKFDEELDSGRYAEIVQADHEEGMRIGVTSTPSVYVNGKLMRDRSREALKAAIDAALSEASKKTP